MCSSVPNSEVEALKYDMIKMTGIVVRVKTAADGETNKYYENDSVWFFIEVILAEKRLLNCYGHGWVHISFYHIIYQLKSLSHGIHC